MNMAKISAFLILSTTLRAGGYEVSLTNDVVFSQFKGSNSRPTNYPDLIGVRVSRSLGGLSVFVKYAQTAGSSIFKYSVDAVTYNGAQKFPLRHFDMEYHTDMNMVSTGLMCQQGYADFNLNVGLSIGRANYSSRFVNTESDTADGSVVYGSNGLASELGASLTKSFGPLVTGVDFGYLFADAGHDTFRAAQDYYLNGRKQLGKGSSISGPLDYSGMTLGVRVGYSF